MKSIYLLLVLFLLSCGTTSKVKSESQTHKVLEIFEYDNLYGLKTINENTNKENFIVSLKESYFKERNLSIPILKKTLDIKKGRSYDFDLQSIKPRVGQSQNLGAYIIVENDTLLREENYKDLPLSYTSKNTIGLSIGEKE